MNLQKKIFTCFFFIFGCGMIFASPSPNQTQDLSPIHPNSQLPFTIKIKRADFSLPIGFHSGASAIYEGKWLFIAGRTNGLHGFANDDDNFPTDKQNTNVIVVDPHKKKVYKKSLSDPSSGLTQEQIDLLSVTSPQSYQWKNTLYVSGGYGVDTATGQFSTKDCLSAINIPGLIHWVIEPSRRETAAEHIRQIFDPLFQVTGGAMFRVNDDLSLLIFGQNFSGFYEDSSNGQYTQQVRRFRLIDNGVELAVVPKHPIPRVPNPNYRRRDLNVVPIIQKVKEYYIPMFTALSGVFTLDTGVWTVPVLIYPDGSSSMADPNDPETFKQGMNNYVSATIGLYSKKMGDMFEILLGGISFGFFENGVFTTDSEIPFINQVTTVKINKKGEFKQYLMDNQYPRIISKGPNPGNPLLFGSGAEFMLAEDIPIFKNGVIKYDSIPKKRTLLGYIVGGIQSTLPNTNVITDSTASAYIFEVFLDRE